jgi:hypothetical protein
LQKNNSPQKDCVRFATFFAIFFDLGLKMPGRDYGRR